MVETVYKYVLQYISSQLCIHGLHTDSLKWVGVFTAQKSANATSQDLVFPREPIVKYLQHTNVITQLKEHLCAACPDSLLRCTCAHACVHTHTHTHTHTPVDHHTPPIPHDSILTYCISRVGLIKGRYYVFPVVMYGCESWTIKKAERQRIDASEL